MLPIIMQLTGSGSKPVHSCAHSVPRSVEQLLKEVARLVDSDVLEEDCISKWDSTLMLEPFILSCHKLLKCVKNPAK
jgi:hypothetical protein